MKKILSPILCLLLLLQLSLPVLAEEPHAVTPIRSTDDFFRFAAGCVSDTYSAGKSFSLETDLDLTGMDFEPIPWFGGSFDGKQHSIRGLSFSGAGSRQGLFRVVAEDAQISALTVSGSISPGGTAGSVGGIAGVNNGRIIGCSFEGAVSGIENVGGIVGYNSSTGLLSHCVFSGTVTGEHQIGGVAGLNDGTVSDCTSSGHVNTVMITPSESTIGSGLLNRRFDISELSEDDFLNLSNIGGIVGENSGIVEGCHNLGNVGYQSTGYNVGGIVGKSSGFVSGCENSAEILGRRDIGGIVGQLIPYSDWDFSSGRLDGLSWQIGLLNVYLGSLTSDISNYSTSLADSISRIHSDITSLVSGITALVEVPNENIHRILDSIGIDPLTGEIYFNYPELANIDTTVITAAVTNLYAESLLLADMARESSGTLAADLRAVSAQLTNVLNELFSTVSAIDELGAETSDLSESEAWTRNTGAIASCSNTGRIQAEDNAGGILGNAAFEVEFDMEDRLNVSDYLTGSARHQLFAAVRSCSCVAEVEAKNGTVGGVAGNMDLGVVTGCTVAGAVSSITGDCVGGIIGSSMGSVLDSWARVLLSGKKYIGGIAGLGNNIRGCRSWTHFEQQQEYAGAVAGWTEGEVRQNLYVLNRPAGVDGISISGETDPLSEADFLNLDGIPLQFGNILIRYRVEGKIVSEETIPFGGTLGNIPVVENRDGDYWSWDLPQQEHIFSSLIIDGRYCSPKSTLASREDPPLFLVEGQFYEGQELQVLPALAPELPGDQLASGTLSVSGYDNELKVRMLTDTNGILYLFDSDGRSNQVSYSRDGSYIVFRMPNGGSFSYRSGDPRNTLHAIRETPLPILIAIVLSLFTGILILVIYAFRSRKRRRKRRKPDA